MVLTSLYTNTSVEAVSDERGKAIFADISVGVDLERGGWTLGLFKGFMGAFLLLGLGQARGVLAGSQALPNGLAVHDLTS